MPAAAGQFRVNPGLNLNFNDDTLEVSNPSGNATSGWTTGVTQIDQVPANSFPGNRGFDLLGFTITAFLTMQQGSRSSYFGKLGPLVGFVSVRGAVATTGPASTQNGVILPADNRVTVWDPAQDPLPPTATYPGVAATPLPVSASMEFPQPIAVQLGDPILVGLCATPSLLSCLNTLSTPVIWLAVLGAGYSIQYQ